MAVSEDFQGELNLLFVWEKHSVVKKNKIRAEKKIFSNFILIKKLLIARVLPANKRERTRKKEKKKFSRLSRLFAGIIFFKITNAKYFKSGKIVTRSVEKNENAN